MQRCHVVLHAFSRCMREQQWYQVTEQSGRVNREMELLRMSFMDHQGLEDELANEVRDLQSRLSELQHQMSQHINTVDIGHVCLDTGMQGIVASRAM